MQKIGIYSGTFDPLHEGHIAFALATLDECGLDKVVFLPESNPRGKHHVMSVIKRAAHITKTVKGNPRFSVFVSSSSPFTVTKTLPELQMAFPETSFTFLFGSDVALRLKDWTNIEIMLAGSSLAIGMRSGQTEELIMHSMKQLEATCRSPIHYVIIHTDKADFASSNVK